MSVDFNRGMIRRMTPAGVVVFEYKDARGAYMDANGKPIGEDMAEAAGFDLLGGRVEKRRKELVAEVQAEADARLREEFAGIQKRVEDEHAAEAAKENSETPFSEAENAEPIPLPDLKLVEDNEGKFSVVENLGTEDENVLTSELSGKEGRKLIKRLLADAKAQQG